MIPGQAHAGHCSVSNRYCVLFHYSILSSESGRRRDDSDRGQYGSGVGELQ